MTNRITACAATLAPSAVAEAAPTQPAASGPAAVARKHKSSSASASASRASPPTNGPSAVAPNTYRGAAGKKPNAGTACGTARLEKDGAIDCGTPGTSATPHPPR
jgi:hypothetical protein